jgi:hypothetical protein
MYINEYHLHAAAQQLPRCMERVRDVLGATADAYIAFTQRETEEKACQLETKLGGTGCTGHR